MIRLWTYVTLDADGEPTVGGTAYDIRIHDLSVQMGDNYYESPLRTGNVLLTYDTETLFEVRGRLIILSNDVDLKSLVQYTGNYRYLGPNLYHHYKYHLPIVLYLQGINNTAAKCYVCKIRKLDSLLAAQAIVDDTALMHFSTKKGDKSLSFDLHISKTGVWTDFDDITASAWEPRV